MPLREFGCEQCAGVLEMYHPSLDPFSIEPPPCPRCQEPMQILFSVPNIDTSDSFHPFDYRGPDGRQWHISNLHELRKVEHAYLESGHNVRFDAYSAEPSNPDPVDGFGLEHWDGKPNSTSSKVFALPTMK